MNHSDAGNPRGTKQDIINNLTAENAILRARIDELKKEKGWLEDHIRELETCGNINTPMTTPEKTAAQWTAEAVEE